MVIRYFQYPLAAFELAAEIDRNRYGSRKRHTVRPETAKGAVADLYFLIDQSGGEVSYNPRFWGMRWEWNHAEVDRLLKRLIGAGLLAVRTKGDGSRTLIAPKRDVSRNVTKQPAECKQEQPATPGQTGKVVPLAQPECKQDVSTVSSNYQGTAKKHSAQDQVIATSGSRRRWLSPEQSALFLAFWKAWADPRGRAEAAWAFSEIVGFSADLVRERIIPAASAYAIEREELKRQGRTPKMAQGWLNGRRWEDYTPATAPQGVSAAEETRKRFLQ
jgi:hypothetical protein